MRPEAYCDGAKLWTSAASFGRSSVRKDHHGLPGSLIPLGKWRWVLKKETAVTEPSIPENYIFCQCGTEHRNDRASAAQVPDCESLKWMASHGSNCVTASSGE